MRKFVFLEGNQIIYGQDFSQWQGVDSDVVFTEHEQKYFKNDRDVWFKAPGYGADPYGNGRIVITREELRKNKAFVRLVK